MSTCPCLTCDQLRRLAVYCSIEAVLATNRQDRRDYRRASDEYAADLAAQHRERTIR